MSHSHKSINRDPLFLRTRTRPSCRNEDKTSLLVMHHAPTTVSAHSLRPTAFSMHSFLSPARILPQRVDSGGGALLPRPVFKSSKRLRVRAHSFAGRKRYSIIFPLHRISHHDSKEAQPYIHQKGRISYEEYCTRYCDCQYKNCGDPNGCIVTPIHIGLNTHFLYFQLLYLNRAAAAAAAMAAET